MSQSIDGYLRKQDPEDVLRMAEALYEMQQTEGWDLYTDLLHIHREWLIGQATQPVMANANPSAAFYASINGIIRGIEHAEEMPAKMEKAAHTVREAMAQRNGDG